MNCQKEHRDYWDSTGQVFFTGNHGYGLTPELATICLGTENDILAYLAGGPLPDCSPVIREELLRIKELKVKGDIDNARAAGANIKAKSSRNQRAINTRGVRAGLTANTKYKPLGTGQFKALQRVSRGKT